MKLKFPSIKGTSFIIARYIAEKQNENHAKRYIYYFSLQVVIGAIIKGIIIFGSSLVLNLFWEVVICSLVFGTSRMYAGGFHANTYLKCLSYTLIILFTTTIASKILVNYYPLYVNILVFAVAILITYIKAPLDSPNKPILSEGRRKRAKVIALIINSVWLGISVLLIVQKLHIQYVPIIGLTALVASLMLTSLFNGKAVKKGSNCAQSCTLL